MKNFTKFVVGVVAIIVRNGRVLALRRTPHKNTNPGVWESISGKVEVGEDPKETLIREIKEESGLEVDIDPRPIYAFQTHFNDEEPMILIFYQAHHVAGEVKLSHEHDNYAWLTAQEFSQRTIFPRLSQLVNLTVNGDLHMALDPIIINKNGGKRVLAEGFTNKTQHP